MSNVMRQFLSGLLAGLIAAGTATLALAADMPQGAGLNDISGVTWMVVIVGGAMAAFKDWKTLLADPMV